MILSAFDKKFDKKNKLKYLPGAVDPNNKFPKIRKSKNMQQEMGPAPARPPERGVQGAQPPGKKRDKGMKIELNKP